MASFARYGWHILANHMISHQLYQQITEAPAGMCDDGMLCVMCVQLLGGRPVGKPLVPGLAARDPMQ